MSSHGKTRLVCRVLRLRDAMTDSRATAHVSQCADCQAYYRATDNLIGQLRQPASRAQQPTTDELVSRINRAVRQAAPQPRRSSPVLWWTSSLAGAAAVMAMTLLVVQRDPRPQIISQNYQNAPTFRAADVTAVVDKVNALSTRIVTTVGPSAVKLATDNPLTQELDSVQADARTALRFLALNFLPSESATPLKSPSEQTTS